MHTGILMVTVDFGSLLMTSAAIAGIKQFRICNCYNVTQATGQVCLSATKVDSIADLTDFVALSLLTVPT
jgi:hypothetical protein